MLQHLRVAARLYETMVHRILKTLRPRRYLEDNVELPGERMLKIRMLKKFVLIDQLDN